MSGWNRRWTGPAVICAIQLCRHSYSNDSGCYIVKTVLKPGSFYDYQSSWNDHYNPRIQCKKTFFTLQLLFLSSPSTRVFVPVKLESLYEPKQCTPCFTKKELPQRYYSHFLGQSSPQIFPGLCQRIPGNSTEQKETKNGEKKRRAFQLSQWVHWEKMAPVEISSSKRWQERSKPHFQGPKKPVKKMGGEMGPKHKPRFFHGCYCGEISHPTYTGIISPHFFAGFWAHLVKKERKFCSSCYAFIRRFLFRSKVELLGVFWVFCPKTMKFTQIGWCISHTCTVLCILAPKKRTVSQKNLTKRLLTPTTHKLAINWATLILSDTLCDLK